MIKALVTSITPTDTVLVPVITVLITLYLECAESYGTDPPLDESSLAQNPSNALESEATACDVDGDPAVAVAKCRVARPDNQLATAGVQVDRVIFDAGRGVQTYRCPQARRRRDADFEDFEGARHRHQFGGSASSQADEIPDEQHRERRHNKPGVSTTNAEQSE